MTKGRDMNSMLHMHYIVAIFTFPGEVVPFVFSSHPISTSFIIPYKILRGRFSFSSDNLNLKYIQKLETLSKYTVRLYCFYSPVFIYPALTNISPLKISCKSC